MAKVSAGTGGLLPRARSARSHRIGGVRGFEPAPHRGRRGRWPATRELVIPGTPCIVPYRVKGDLIEILRVFHGTRLWPEEPPA